MHYYYIHSFHYSYTKRSSSGARHAAAAAAAKEGEVTFTSQIGDDDDEERAKLQSRRFSFPTKTHPLRRDEDDGWQSNAAEAANKD